MVVVNAHQIWQVVLFAVCIGIGFGGGLVCFMSVLSNYYGTAAFASLAGLAIAVNTTLSAIAPQGGPATSSIEASATGRPFIFWRAGASVGSLVLFLMRRPDNMARRG